MRLSIFAGTFNPVHLGHLIMAESVREQLNLDKVFFVTSNNPPHRNNNIAPANHRHSMVQLCCQHNPYFEALDCELKREGLSYTYHTLMTIQQTYNIKEKLYFIIGCDAFVQLNTWNYYKEICDIAKFIIVMRPSFPSVEDCIKKLDIPSIEYEKIHAPMIGISSTMIRNNIELNLSNKYLVTEEVEQYLKKYKLYQE